MQEAKSEKPQTEKPQTAPIVYLIAVLGGFAGLLYGYDSGAISLALPSITTDFGLNANTSGMVVSFMLFGALPSIVVFTALEKKIERRNVLIFGGIVFIVGSLIAALAPNTNTILAGRFILGIACGIANMYGLIYLSELAPTHIRGVMSSMYQLCVNLGILGAYAIGAHNLPTNDWRWTIGIGIIPALVFAIGMMLSPQSPRWLVRDGQVDKARRVLSKVRVTKAEVDSEIADIEGSLKIPSAGLRELLSKQFRPALILLEILTFFQVFTGINAAVYYAPEIFKNLGMADSMVVADYAVGFALVIPVIIAMPLIDRLGRKTLLEISLAGQVLPSVVLCLFQNNAIVAIVCIMLYCAAFSIGLGPVFWTYVPEILPLKARGLGVGVITFSQYLMNAIFSWLFPIILQMIGINIFYFFAGLSVVAVWYIHKYVYETKGQSLEAIEKYWTDRIKD